MDEVVVTATREEEEIRKIPRNVTVITSDDIAQASSNNVVDLLAREANLNLRSSFGNDKKAGIDIRGMGDTYVSNVVVMVDGFRLNSPDLAGPDFSVVPLEQIERIEIVRGSGCVGYGDGAVGGVINIITKKGESDPELRVSNSYGTYGTYDSRASYGGGVHDLSFGLNGDYYSTEGYRDNGYFRKKNAGITLGYDPGQFASLRFGTTVHDDDYGLPGPVNIDDIDSRDQRDATDHPDDRGHTTDISCYGVVELDLQDFGSLTSKARYRNRENPYVLLNTDEAIDENSWEAGVDYIFKYNIHELEQRFLCGTNYFDSSYLREEIGILKKNSDVSFFDWYLSHNASLTESMSINTGYRRSRYEGELRDDRYTDFYTTPPPPPPIIPPEYLYSAWVRGQTRKNTWKNRAFDLGVTWLPNDSTTLFVSYARSYRNPNVDELVETDESEGLVPQKGRHWDFGIRHRMKGVFEASVTCFQIRIEDEIYYGESAPGVIVNRNYEEETIRRGMEFDFKYYPFESLYLWGNFSYMKAEFDESHDEVPLVPRDKATIGLEWQVMEPMTLSVTGTRVGRRYDGNDERNDQYPKLDAYQVLDAKLSYEFHKIKVFGGVNNIFDEFYSTSAYSANYYPMPLRNGYVGMEVKF